MKIIRICLENIISSSVIGRSRLSYLWNTSTSFHFSCFIEHFFSCLLLSSLSAALPPCWQRLCSVCVIWTQALQIKHAVLSSQEATHITFIFFGFFLFVVQQSLCIQCLCFTVFILFLYFLQHALWSVKSALLDQGILNFSMKKSPETALTCKPTDNSTKYINKHQLLFTIYYLFSIIIWLIMFTRLFPLKNKLSNKLLTDKNRKKPKTNQMCQRDSQHSSNSCCPFCTR